MFTQDHSDSIAFLSSTVDASAFLVCNDSTNHAVFVTPTGAWVFGYCVTVDDWFVVHSIAYTGEARASVLEALESDTRALYALATGALVQCGTIPKRALWNAFYRHFDGLPTV